MSNSNQLGSHILAMTYMSMIDSLQSELLFGGAEKYLRRLNAIWTVLTSRANPNDDVYN